MVFSRDNHKNILVHLLKEKMLDFFPDEVPMGRYVLGILYLVYF